MCNPGPRRHHWVTFRVFLAPISSLILTVILTLGPSLWAQAQDAEDVRQRLGELQQQISEIEQRLNRDRGEISDLEDELKALDRKVSQQSQAVRSADTQIAQKDQQLAELNQERDSLVRALGTQREALAELLRAAYASGRGERLRLLLSQDDPDRIMRTLAYYEYIQSAREEQMVDLMRQMQRLTDVEQAIAVSRRELEVMRQQRLAELEQLRGTRISRENVLVDLRRAVEVGGREISELETQREQLESVLRAIEEALADIPVDAGGAQFSTLKGVLDWPVAGVVRHRFGQQRAGGQRWQGVLIEAAAGTEVHAVSAGRVVFSDWLRGHGLLLIVDHGEGFLSLYAYNQTLFAEVGEWVGRGQAVATVGASGGRSETGLYFELRQDGRAISPQSWFAQATPVKP